MIKTNDIITQKQRVLETLKIESSRALDIVTSTINQLATVSEINEAKSKLQSTEDELNQTRVHNTRIIDKFRALIEE